MQARGGDVIRSLTGRLALFSLLVLGGVGADQITKSAAFSRIGEGQSRGIVGGVLRFTCRRNTGTVFGLFQGSNEVFIALTAIAIVVIIIYFLKTTISEGVLMTTASALIVAGAVGNLVDRIIFQSVRDFIDLCIWPIFNVADMLICIGAVGLAYASLRTIGNESVRKHEQSG